MTTIDILNLYEGYFINEAVQSAYKYYPDNVKDDLDALFYGWEHFIWRSIN